MYPDFRYPDSSSKLPLVVICNTFEAYAAFLNRAEGNLRDRLWSSIQVAGDRSLLWLGDRKLVVTSAPVPHLEYVRDRLGYSHTRCISPEKPTDCLSLDIQRETALIQQLVEYAGDHRTLQLVPFATTPELLQLAETLRQQYQLTVLLPESPAPEALWLRELIETKQGFRTLAGQWLPDADTRLPQGFVARNMHEAGAIAQWFTSRHQSCLVKANAGVLGIGQTVIEATQPSPDFTTILAMLQYNPFVHEDLLIVEAMVPSKEPRLSPSAEFVVPPLGQGAPFLTHVGNQIFSAAGIYTGELVSREWQTQSWYPTLVNSGLKIADQLQALGYVGHFDLDAIVCDRGDLYLLEVNARRTGGTHVHELAHFLLGENYLDRGVLLSRTTVESGSVNCLEGLLERLRGLLYPMQGHSEGVVISHSSALEDHQFGYVILAASTQAALDLQQQVMQRLQSQI